MLIWEIIVILIIVCFVLWLFGLEGIVNFIISMAILFGILYGIGCIIGLGIKGVIGL